MALNKSSLRYSWFLFNKWLDELREFLRLLLPDKSAISVVCFSMAVLCVINYGIFAVMTAKVVLEKNIQGNEALVKAEARLAKTACEGVIGKSRQRLHGPNRQQMLQEMADRVREVQCDTAIYFCVVDSNALLLASPRADWTGDSLVQCNRMEGNVGMGTSAMAKMMDDECVFIDGVSYHRHLMSLHGTDLKLAMLIPHDRFAQMFAHLFPLTRNLLLCVVFMLFGFMVMFVTMRRAIQQRSVIKGEVDVAAQLQQKMVPQQFPAFPNRSDFDLYGVLQPARVMGGDLYDFLLRDNKLVFCLGDVSGKGMPAALVMSVVHSVFRAAASHTSDPAEINSMINEAVAHGNDSNMFCTLFTGVLELATGRLHYSNAGHNLPVILSSDGTTHFLEAMPNIALGVIEEFPYQAQKVTLPCGTSLITYSDGVTEAESVDKRLFGDAALLKALEGKANLSPELLMDGLLKDLRLHTRFAEQSDDITMLGIKVN